LFFECAYASSILDDFQKVHVFDDSAT